MKKYFMLGLAVIFVLTLGLIAYGAYLNQQGELQKTAHGESGIMELTLSLAEPIARLTEKERKGIMETATQKEIFSIAKEAGFFA